MTIEPDVGDTVYAPMFDRTGVVEQFKGEWAMIEMVDGTAALECHKLVVPSKHAMSRWRTRVGDGDASERIAEGWMNGTVLDGPHGMHGDEVRLDTDADVVLVRKENAVATVLARRDWKPRLQGAVEAVE